MNWVERYIARQGLRDQTITLKLDAKEWAELQEWAESYDWTPAEMVTIWIRNRMHGIGRIAN